MRGMPAARWLSSTQEGHQGVHHPMSLFVKGVSYGIK
jgi:hypothetical protein